MTRAASWSGALVALTLAAPAFAGEVAIGAFAGPGAAPVRAALSRAVCEQVDCVAAPKGKKAKKKTPPVLTGKVAKNKKRVEISLVKAGKPAWKKSYPLTAGKLGGDSLEKIAAQVVKSVGGKVSEPEPLPEPAFSPQTTSSSDTAAVASSSTGEESRLAGDDWPEKSAPSAEEQRAAEPDAEVSASSDGAGQLRTISLSVNLDLLSRSFSYDALTTANLHKYTGFPIAAPSIHLDAYPLMRLTKGLLAGLGLEADLAFSLGLKAVLSGVAYPSQILRFNGALKFRLPLTASGIALVPAVGVGYTSFSLSAAEDGSTLTDLPEVSYLTMRVGAGIDAPLLNDKVLLRLGVAYLPLFSAGELISAGYFPEGTGWGLGLNASAGYRVFSPLEIRLGFAMERYSLSFLSIPEDTYRATGAVDLLWSISLGAGYVW